MKSFEIQYSFYQNVFEDFCQKAVREQKNLLMKNCRELGYRERLYKFFDSVDYSLMNGGKRFRPVLTLAVCDLFGKNHSTVLPYAMAVEMIHTYSLIHDDLPCMDNDDERRGKPTNHKIYGESTALLAGDALLTDAFKMASLSESRAELVLQSIALLSDCAGTAGMVGGQYCDLEGRRSQMSFPELLEMQKNKTGALIRAAGVGAAILCEAETTQQKNIEEFSQKLGLCFQLADDILDKDKNETNSIVGTTGLEKSKTLLEEITKECLTALTTFPGAHFLQQLAEYNARRLK